MRSRFLVVPIFLAAVVALSPLHANSLAMDVTNTTGYSLGNPPFVLGWQFTVNTPIMVTALDIFDDSQDGLVDSYPAAIWTTGGTLMVSGIVDAGTVDPLNGMFRSKAVTPTLLGPGDYDIGALYLTGDDPLVFAGNASGVTSIPEITFDASEFAGSSILQIDSFSVSNQPGYFGPDFEASPVPEPASLLLFGTAAAGISVFVRRRRAKSQR